jgi:mannitol/fructose-specific phosphotransferase system IIA component (Ntr-type)
LDAQSGQPVGYLLTKDLIGLSADAAWSRLVRPLGAVNADDNTESTLQHFQREGATICQVTDRGSLVGVVTIEDILEQVVGRIEDEYPQHPKVRLRDLILTDDALLDLSSTTCEQAIAEMASSIPSERLPEHANIAALAISREREISTNVGFGVAIPHARCAHLASPLVVFGRSMQGIAFDGQSKEPVHFVFLLVTPIDQPDLQVHLLSQVASFAGNPENLRRLRMVSSATEIGQVMDDAEGHSRS